MNYSNEPSGAPAQSIELIDVQYVMTPNIVLGVIGAKNADRSAEVTELFPRREPTDADHVVVAGRKSRLRIDYAEDAPFPVP